MNRLPLASILAATCLLFTLSACDDGGGSNTADSGAKDVSGDTSVKPDSGGPDGSGDTTGPDTDAAAATCNPISDEGCTEGQTCSYNPDSTAPLCVAKGVLAATAGCGGGLGTCDHGICLSLNDTGNLCYEFCKINAHCPTDSECLELTGSIYKVCKISGIYKNCELMGDAACGAGKGCYSTSDEPDPICLPVGSAADGESCGNVANGCAAGLACVNTACTRLCDKTATKPCGDEFTQCSNYLDASSKVGICVK